MIKNKLYEKEIKLLVSKIAKEYNPNRVYLFGSYARGNPTADSDVDLFIVKNTAKPQKKRRRELRGLLFGSGVPFDLFIYTPNEINKRLKMGDFFIKDIVNKGKILYEKK